MQLNKRNIGMLLMSALSAVGTISIVTKCANNGEVRIELEKQQGTVPTEEDTTLQG